MNRMDKDRKLYILLVVAIPFAVAAVVLAWSAGRVFTPIYYGALLVSWVVYVLISVLKNLQTEREEKGIPYY